MTVPFFKVSNLSKSFGGLKAVDQLTFQVERNMIFSIIGPNGAGKSTIFNCINGLYQPEEGIIDYKGQNLVGLRPDQVAQQRIARTFQNLELFAHMSTMDNLLLGRHLHMKAKIWQILGLNIKRSKAAQEEIAHRQKVEEIIDFLELQSARNQFVSALPLWQTEAGRIGHGRWPSIQNYYLLDEPAAGLNQEEREEMVFWIKDIRNQLGITVILIEHNMQMVSSISDRILAVNFGKKLVEGTADEVLNHPEVIQAYLGS